MTNDKKLKNKKGFVILFAVTLSAILLSIALGVSNIAFNQAKFSTSVKNTNDAFFAADVGAEQALFWDYNLASRPDGYPDPAVGDIVISSPFVVIVSAEGGACARVTIEKDYSGAELKTTIVSKGYNIGDENCQSSSSNRVEREIRVTL